MDEKNVREKAETKGAAERCGNRDEEGGTGKLVSFLVRWQTESLRDGTVPDIGPEIIREAGFTGIPAVSERFELWQRESYATALWLLRGRIKAEAFHIPGRIRDYTGRLQEIRAAEPAVREGLIEFFERESGSLICYRRFLPGGRDAAGEIMVMCNLGGRMEHVHTPYDIVSYTGMLGNYESSYDRKELRPFECIVLRHR